MSPEPPRGGQRGDTRHPKAQPDSQVHESPELRKFSHMPLWKVGWHEPGTGNLQTGLTQST